MRLESMHIKSQVNFSFLDYFFSKLLLFIDILDILAATSITTHAPNQNNMRPETRHRVSSLRYVFLFGFLFCLLNWLIDI